MMEVAGWALVVALLVTAGALVAAAMGGCAGFGSAKAPEVTTKITPAEAKAKWSHVTTPASTTVTEETTITIKLPEAPAAPLAPGAPVAPETAEGTEGPRDRGTEGAPQAAAFVPRLLREIIGVPPRMLALTPALLAQINAGGQRVDGAPPGSTIEVRTKKGTTTSGAAVDARADTSGKGAGAETNAPEGVTDFDAGAPAATAPPMPGAAKGAATGGASGGETKAEVSWEQAVTIPGTSINLFQIVGCVLLLGAVGVFVAGRGFPGVGLLTGPLAGVLAAVGGASLALGFLLESPWWVKALVIGVPVAGGVILLVPRVRKLAKELEAKAQSEKTIDDLNKVVNAAVVGIETGDATGDVKKAVHLASAGWRDDVDRVVQRVLREAGFGYGAASDGAKKPAATAAPAP